jgi:hypothetical protein
MKSAFKEELFKALTMRPDRGEAKEDQLAQKILEWYVEKELALVELLIDQHMNNRETELRSLMICGHSLACLKLAPWSQQNHTGNPHLTFADAKNAKYVCLMCEREKFLVRALLENLKATGRPL